MEDDEDKAGSKSFKTTVGAFSNIIALNDALIGMKVGGTRRFAILPQQGWEKATKICDGEFFLKFIEFEIVGNVSKRKC